MKCLVSCVTYEPKLRPTMLKKRRQIRWANGNSTPTGNTYQCQVGLYFLSNSFLMYAAISFSMLYFSKAWVAMSTSQRQTIEWMCVSKVRQWSLTCILLHVLGHIGILDNSFAISHDFDVSLDGKANRTMISNEHWIYINLLEITKTTTSDSQIKTRSIYTSSSEKENERNPISFRTSARSQKEREETERERRIDAQPFKQQQALCTNYRARQWLLGNVTMFLL